MADAGLAKQKWPEEMREIDDVPAHGVRARSRSTCCAQRAAGGGRAREREHRWDARRVGDRRSGSRCTASSRPRRSCSAAAPTCSATSPTPTCARCASACPARCRCSTRRRSSCALRLGQALHCTAKPGVFARKNYFYPDMPKDYQVSQYDQPTNVDGWLDLPSGVARRHRARATSRRTPARTPTSVATVASTAPTYSLIDYNRAGVPLVEIVSRPDLRGSEQAREYVERAARHPARHRGVRRAHGGGFDAGRRQRVRAP